MPSRNGVRRPPLRANAPSPSFPAAPATRLARPVGRHLSQVRLPELAVVREEEVAGDPRAEARPKVDFVIPGPHALLRPFEPGGALGDEDRVGVRW